MQKHILNTDRRTFLISFLHRSTNNTFIFQEPNELKFILETYDNTGIEKIQEFNRSKNKFLRISKKDILKVCSWETETAEYLKTHYFFK